tara:strand:- start:460 stop:1389 length:930 start_codon:yes stop_codon:yes gene_type:complete
MADEITFTGLSSAGGRVANVLSAMLFEKLHDPTDLRAVMTEVPWNQIGSDTMRVTVDGAPGAFAAATSETAGGGANSAYGSAKFDLQIARYIRRYQMSDLFGVSGGPIDVNAVVQTLADGVGLTMTDILTPLFNALSSSVDSGTTFTVDGFYNAVYTLNLAGAVSSAEAPYSLVLHPKQMNELRTSIRGEGAGSPIQYVSAELIAARGPGYQGKWQGVDIWQADSISQVDGSSHYSAGMFAKDCFAYTMAPVKALTGHVPASNIILDAGELLIESDRDSVNGLTTALASMFVAVSETQDALGCEIKSDV